MKEPQNPLSKHFQTLRKILLSYSQIKEVKNIKQTSYYDEYGVIVMQRIKDDALVVAFGKGAKLQKLYPQLSGDGKVVRHLYFKADEVIDEALLRAMIEESLALSIEAHELKVMRCKLK